MCPGRALSGGGERRTGLPPFSVDLRAAMTTPAWRTFALRHQPVTFTEILLHKLFRLNASVAVSVKHQSVRLLSVCLSVCLSHRSVYLS